MPNPDPTYEHLVSGRHYEASQAPYAPDFSAKALAASRAPAQPSEQAGYVLLRGVTSPAGTEQWQAVSGIHQERHLGYLQRLRTEQQESHPEDFWRFEIATVTIPGVTS